MDQPSIHDLRTLRLEALARDDEDTDALLTIWRNIPPAMANHLIDEHGWAPHEAMHVVMNELQQQIKMQWMPL